MSVTVIQDLRWGDTGKGKISEYLSRPDVCDVSVRAVGGGNAGHVIVVGTRKLALHILPAGCVHEGVDLVLGRGMVTHLPTLFDDAAKANDLFGTDPLSHLLIAEENHILFNGHKAADAALEERKGAGAVGTTKSGIGPAYADKALRVGMRMEELRKPVAALKDVYAKLLLHWAATYGVALTDEEQVGDIAALAEGKEKLEGRICNLTEYWKGTFARRERVVVEGAQGSLLSIDNSGYPYVTSSSTTVNGHMQGAGIPPKELTTVIGTLKAYDTRVGNGPMRMNMDPETAARIQKRGGEFGSTTGRGRTVNWLDAEDAAIRALEESVDSLAVLKADVFDGEEEIRVGVGMDNGTPQYEHFYGWEESIAGLDNEEALPTRANVFFKRLEELLGRKIDFYGTGPESKSIIDRRAKHAH